MQKLVDFSLKQVSVIIIMVVLLFLGGSYSALNLQTENMPNISFPTVMITTVYPASPNEVLERITKPIENTLASLDEVKNISSTSSDNFSQIIVELNAGQSPDKAKAEVESLLNSLELPDEAGRPMVYTEGFASVPVFRMSVHTAPGESQTVLDRALEETILPKLQSLAGLDHMDIVGQRTRVMSIRFDADKINYHNLSPSEIADQLTGGLSSHPAGEIQVSGNKLMVHVKGKINSLTELQNYPVNLPNGSSITLDQLTTIESIYESKFLSRFNDQPAVAVNLYKTNSTNVVDFSEQVAKLSEDLQRDLPELRFETVQNSAIEIKSSINGMIREGAIGGLLAAVMILVFLRNLRMTLIVTVSIPLSILFSLLLMGLMDISLNIMTLGGMAIAIGRVVDDTIVVIENIYSELNKVTERSESHIKIATLQVASAITSSTLTTVAVFTPIAFVSGVVGQVFMPFAITLICALMASLLVALTVVPMLAKLFVLRAKHQVVDFENKQGKVSAGYRSILNWTLNRPIITLALAGICFVVTVVFTIPQLPVSFMPSSKSQKAIYFQVSLPKESSMGYTDSTAADFEHMLSEKEGTFTYIQSLIGYNYSEDQYPYIFSIFAEVAGNQDAKALISEYKQMLELRLPEGSNVEAGVLSFDDGESYSLYSYSLKGDDYHALRDAALMVKDELQNFEDLYSIKDSLSEEKQELSITVDQDKAKLYGVNPVLVADAVNLWISDMSLGELKLNHQTYELKAGLSSKDKNSKEKIEKLLIKTPTGAPVYLSEIASVDMIQAPVTIERDNKKQVVHVTALIDSDNVGGVSEQATMRIKELHLPAGVTGEETGVSEEIDESFNQMFIAMIVSVLVVYLVMVIAFGNARAPFAIMFSLPLAAIGGLIALLITNESLNVTSLIGFLMLIGIVVANAIVLIDRVQQLRQQGFTVREALLEAGMSRLRPIIMTAGTTVIALIPLAMGFSEGTLISKGLAVVVIGGMITSTLLTLVVVPCVYALLESGYERIVGRFLKKVGENNVEERSSV
ncbi:efflux RND transporter permease subunit [Paenibacillus lentus]|uniref:efflux RND transporter permease subunit n=1 Tax=Paenibacillus lentus TaxID=1338368 RepID=UPI003650CA3D